MKWVTICFLSLAITVGFSTAQDETEEELTKFKEFKVLYYLILFDWYKCQPISTEN